MSKGLAHRRPAETHLLDSRSALGQGNLLHIALDLGHCGTGRFSRQK